VVSRAYKVKKKGKKSEGRGLLYRYWMGSGDKQEGKKTKKTKKKGQKKNV